MRAVSSGTGGTGCGRRSDMGDLWTRKIPFVRLAATCSENGFTGLWTGGQFRTALSAEVRSYRARPRRLLPAQSHPLNATDPSICWMLASLAVAGAFRASSALLLAFGRKIGGPSPVQGKRAVAPVDPTSQRQSALSSLGGVLEHGGCPMAHRVQDLRLVLIRIARGLDRSRGVSHQLADDRNKALTFGRMPVGLQDKGGFAQRAQIAHDLGIRALAQPVLTRDRRFEVEVGHAAMGQRRAAEREDACNQAQNRKGSHGELP